MRARCVTARVAVAALPILLGVMHAQAADLAPDYRPAAVVAPPIVVAPGAVMLAPIRSGTSMPIQTHIISQPAPNPRAIGEGPVMGTAPPVIIVVKP